MPNYIPLCGMVKELTESRTVRQRLQPEAGQQVAIDNASLTTAVGNPKMQATLAVVAFDEGWWCMDHL